MIVVSNTSPITNLAAIGQLDLLHKLYGRIVIPQAVFHELTAYGPQIPGAIEVQTESWIETHQVTNQALVIALRAELDEGEAEAIALAHELSADLLLLDERRGRQIAFRLGIHLTGLLGVLIEAKHGGLISALKPLLDDLITKSGFWVSDQLYKHVLQIVGE